MPLNTRNVNFPALIATCIEDDCMSKLSACVVSLKHVSAVWLKDSNVALCQFRQFPLLSVRRSSTVSLSLRSRYFLIGKIVCPWADDPWDRFWVKLYKLGTRKEKQLRGFRTEYVSVLDFLQCCAITTGTKVWNTFMKHSTDGRILKRHRYFRNGNPVGPFNANLPRGFC